MCSSGLKPYSTQLSIKVILLISVKMSTCFGILTFISKTILRVLKQEKLCLSKVKFPGTLNISCCADLSIIKFIIYDLDCPLVPTLYSTVQLVLSKHLRNSQNVLA